MQGSPYKPFTTINRTHITNWTYGTIPWTGATISGNLSNRDLITNNLESAPTPLNYVHFHADNQSTTAEIACLFEEGDETIIITNNVHTCQINIPVETTVVQVDSLLTSSFEYTKNIEGLLSFYHLIQNEDTDVIKAKNGLNPLLPAIQVFYRPTMECPTEESYEQIEVGTVQVITKEEIYIDFASNDDENRICKRGKINQIEPLQIPEFNGSQPYYVLDNMEDVHAQIDPENEVLQNVYFPGHALLRNSDTMDDSGIDMEQLDLIGFYTTNNPRKLITYYFYPLIIRGDTDEEPWLLHPLVFGMKTDEQTLAISDIPYTNLFEYSFWSNNYKINNQDFYPFQYQKTIEFTLSSVASTRDTMHRSNDIFHRILGINWRATYQIGTPPHEYRMSISDIEDIIDYNAIETDSPSNQDDIYPQGHRTNLAYTSYVYEVQTQQGWKVLQEQGDTRVIPTAISQASMHVPSNATERVKFRESYNNYKDNIPTDDRRHTNQLFDTNTWQPLSNCNH